MAEGPSCEKEKRERTTDACADLMGYNDGGHATELIHYSSSEIILWKYIYIIPLVGSLARSLVLRPIEKPFTQKPVTEVNRFAKDSIGGLPMKRKLTTKRRPEKRNESDPDSLPSKI